MNYITTTELRTKSKELIRVLKEGQSVTLIHRSTVVGVLKPQKPAKIITKKDIEQLKKLAKELNLPKTSYEEREKMYRKHLMEKYGKSIS